MKVWVHKKVLLENIKSLPFKAWVKTFNVWVPGEIQCGPIPSSTWAYVRFQPFDGFGKTEARVPSDSIHVDARFSKALIKGGLPLPIYEKVQRVMRAGI